MSSRPVDEARPRRVARPPRRGRGPTTALLVVLVSLAGIPARAALGAAGEGRIDVSAPAGCGNAAATDLGRRVTQRSPRVHLSPDGDRTTTVRVSIEPMGAPAAGPGALKATVTVRQGGAAPWSRRVHTATCYEALDALALILALALDPERDPESTAAAAARGRDTGHPSGRRVPAAKAAGGTSATASAVVDAAHPPVPEPPAAEATEAAKADSPAQDDRAAERPRIDVAPVVAAGRPPSWHWSGIVGAAGAVTTVPAPSLMPGAGIYVSLAADRGSIWSPAFRLALSHFWASRFATAAGTARFTADVATLDLCPLWLRGGAWGLGGCAAITAGVVTGEGTDSFAPQTRRRPFLAPGGSAALKFEAPATRVHLQISGWANAAMPLLRDRFQFQPDVFYRVPRMSLTAGVAVGWRFW